MGATAQQIDRARDTTGAKKPRERLIVIGTEGRRKKSTSDEEPVWLSISATAAKLHTSPDSLKAMIARGTIIAIPVGVTGRHFRIPVAEIDKLRRGDYGDHRTNPQLPGQAEPDVVPHPVTARS